MTIECPCCGSHIDTDECEEVPADTAIMRTWTEAMNRPAMRVPLNTVSWRHVWHDATFDGPVRWCDLRDLWELAYEDRAENFDDVTQAMIALGQLVPDYDGPDPRYWTAERAQEVAS